MTTTDEYKTHNDTKIKVDGTYMHGRIYADYPDLVEKFGPPIIHGDGDKTDAEWALEFEDGTVATVYNWKNGINYCGADGKPVEHITEWNVGGKRGLVAISRVRTALANENVRTYRLVR